MNSEMIDSPAAPDPSPNVESLLEQTMLDIGIPPRPRILDSITEETRKPEPDYNRLASLINADVSLSAGLIKIANSPYFGMRQRVRSVNEALMVLGLNVASRAIAGIVLRQALPISPRMERFWDASARVARLSGWLAQQLRVAGLQPEDAYTFGLFRDCGIPILLTRFPNYDEVLGVANHNARHSFTTVEETVLPTNHAMVGCLLAQSWWLPDELCQAIRNHHDLAKLESAEPQLLVSNRLSAVAQFAEHLVQQHLGLSQTQEWTKLGPACLRLLDLEEQQLAELYSESLPVAKADD
jgi:HD-like signal output (HDOD) protein